MPRAVNPLQTSLFARQLARQPEMPGSPGQGDAVAPTGATRTLTIGDLIGPGGAWLYADACEGCGKLHGGDCPAPVTGPPDRLFDDASDDGVGGLTPLGRVVADAARYLVARGWLDGEWPDWMLADLAAIAQEEPCRPVRASGFLNPSAVADRFMARRQEEWERWLPVWACACGMAFKVNREHPGAAFYAARPDGLMGDLAGYVTTDDRGNVKDSAACPCCGRPFAGTQAARPVSPRARKREAPAEPPLALF